MKKLIALLLALCMVFALCACGEKAAEEPAAEKTTAAPAEAPAAEETAAEEPTEAGGARDDRPDDDQLRGRQHLHQPPV